MRPSTQHRGGAVGVLQFQCCQFDRSGVIGVKTRSGMIQGP